MNDKISYNFKHFVLYLLSYALFTHLFLTLVNGMESVNPDQTALQEQSDLDLYCLHMAFFQRKLVYEILRQLL